MGGTCVKISLNFLILPIILLNLNLAHSAIDSKVWPYVPDVAITVQNNSNRDFTLIINQNPSGKIEKGKSRSIRNIVLSQASNAPNALVTKIDVYDPKADEYITFYLFIKKTGTSDREITTWLMHKNKKIVDEKETIRLSPTDKDHYTIKISIEEDISKSSVDVAPSVS